MKTTEIVTAHNVVIQYELASVFNRAVGLLLDGVIIFVYFLIINIVFAGIISSFSPVHLIDSFGVGYLFYALFLLPMFFYSFWMETIFNGQTVGKMAVGIKVVKLTGETPGMGDLFLRWSFRVIEILPLGAIAALVASSTDKSQRLGGIVSNTCVIRLNPSTSYSISDVLTIKNNENYEPKYPQVVQLTDDDLLLVKNAIDRLRMYPNDAHKQFIRELSKKAAEKLNIEAIPKNKVTFLKTLLQDYIVLTRS